MNLHRRLLAFLPQTAGWLGTAVLAGFLAGLAAAGQAWVLARILGGVFLRGWDLAASSGWLAALAGLLAARAALGWLVETTASAAAAQVKDALREQLLRHVVALGPAFSESERSGELSSALVQGVDALDAYFSQYLPQLALAAMLPVAFLVVVFPVDTLSGLSLLLTGPLIPFFMFLIGSKSQALTGKQWAALGQMSAYFLDTLQGLVTLKSLGRSREQIEQVERVSERYHETTLQVMRLTFLSALALELLSTIGTAVVAVQLGLRLLYGFVDYEPAFFVLLMAPEFYLPLRNLGLRFHASMAGFSAIQRIDAILTLPLPVVAGASTAAGVSSVIGLRSSSPRVDLRQPFEIRFEQVSYRYPGRGDVQASLPQGEEAGSEDQAVSALREVSLSLRSGQRLALVGASGSGKSTLVRLLLRFLEPQEGRILVNGMPLTSLDRDAWLAQIAWVPQSPYLLHDTIAANIRLGNPAASMEDVRRAAQAVALDGWIERLPMGYETPSGEGGARFSGGQAQRLALARAFLRDAPLLVLDEPAAHLDVEQEMLLVESMERLCAGRTVLSITHRLRSAARADVVVVMAAGQVVESGTHADLLAGDGAYARLVRAARGER